jgi:hypothetical protein
MAQAADDLGRLEVEDLDLVLVRVGVERQLSGVGAKGHDAAVKVRQSSSCALVEVVEGERPVRVADGKLPAVLPQGVAPNPP